jgi:hypothetical protein
LSILDISFRLNISVEFVISLFLEFGCNYNKSLNVKEFDGLMKKVEFFQNMKRMNLKKKSVFSNFEFSENQVYNERNFH